MKTCYFCGYPLYGNSTKHTIANEQGKIKTVHAHVSCLEQYVWSRQKMETMFTAIRKMK